MKKIQLNNVIQILSVIITLNIIVFSFYILNKEIKNQLTTYTYTCIDGVEYFTGKLTPHFKSDGTLYLCDEKETK